MIDSLRLMISDAEYHLAFYKDRFNGVNSRMGKNMPVSDRELQVQRLHGFSMAISATNRHINDLKALLSELEAQTGDSNE